VNFGRRDEAAVRVGRVGFGSGQRRVEARAAAGDVEACGRAFCRFEDGVELGQLRDRFSVDRDDAVSGADASNGGGRAGFDAPDCSVEVRKDASAADGTSAGSSSSFAFVRCGRNRREGESRRAC
jgi:hypothetical protein